MDRNKWCSGVTVLGTGENPEPRGKLGEKIADSSGSCWKRDPPPI